MGLKQIAFIIGFSAMICGCASIMERVGGNLADNLNQAILNQDDLETVRSGAPAYLLMVDGLIEGNPENSAMLLAGSKLYASYTSAFVDDDARAKRLAGRALEYAIRALCSEMERLCTALEARPADFGVALDTADAGDVPLLYAFAGAWAGWIQVNSDDWNAVAALPKLILLFERCVVLDESWDDGGAHVYLGVFSTLLPAVLGGKPEIGRAHFERAIELSGGRNLMFKVLMAEHYARAVFDRELHDDLLHSVMIEPIEAPGLTLVNTLARQRAGRLLAGSADFF